MKTILIILYIICINVCLLEGFLNEFNGMLLYLIFVCLFALIYIQKYYFKIK